MSTSTYVEASIEMDDIDIEEINARLDEIVESSDELRKTINSIIQEVK